MPARRVHLIILCTEHVLNDCLDHSPVAVDTITLIVYIRSNCCCQCLLPQGIPRKSVGQQTGRQGQSVGRGTVHNIIVNTEFGIPRTHNCIPAGT